jgi:hypothetical protein
MTTETTPLDKAHAAMEAAPEDDALRLRFYERLADAELSMLLESEAEGEDVSPRLFELDSGPVVLLFDRLERLAEFVGQSAPYASLSGRVAVGLLAPQGLGLALNLGVAPSSFLMPADAVSWLAETVSNRPQELEQRPRELTVPGQLPQNLLTSLDEKLATAGGLARHAYLSGVTYSDGRKGHLLAFVDALPGAEPALARAVGEALTFSGLDAGELDVTFLPASDPISARLATVGLRFDLPAPLEPPARAAPGSDPLRPPILR